MAVDNKQDSLGGAAIAPERDGEANLLVDRCEEQGYRLVSDFGTGNNIKRRTALNEELRRGILASSELCKLWRAPR